MYKKFIEFIEEKINIKNLVKVEDVTFSTSFNKLSVVLIYDENKKEIFTEKIESIEQAIKQYAGENIEVDIIYKKSFLDAEYLKVLLKKYISNLDNSLIKNISENNIKIEKENDNFNIEIFINVSESFKNFYNSLFDKFVSKLQTNFFYKFNIVINYSNYEVKQEFIDNYLENLNTSPVLNFNQEKEYLKVELNDVLYGDKIKDVPVNISKIQTPSNYIITCGYCYNIQKKLFKKEKKSKDKDVITEIEGVRYTFKLKYKNNNISCVYFPKINEKDKEFLLKENTCICIDGRVDEFMNNLTLRVKNINICNIIEEDETPKIFLPIPKNYTKILPEPFISQEQSDFFTYMENKPINEVIRQNKFVVFDVETTGLNSEEDSIIEISAIKIENGIMIESFNTFINPEKEIPEEIIKLTNITNQMVKDAPKDYEMIGDFLKFSDNCILVAYNAPFDMGFLHKLAYKCHYKINNNVDDALVLARQKILGLKNYKLKTVAEYLNVSLVGAHRAINDTLATAKVYMKLLEME